MSYRRENDDRSVEEPRASKGKLTLIFVAVALFFFVVFFGMGRAFHWLLSHLF